MGADGKLLQGEVFEDPRPADENSIEQLLIGFLKALLNEPGKEA